MLHMSVKGFLKEPLTKTFGSADESHPPKHMFAIIHVVSQPSFSIAIFA